MAAKTSPEAARLNRLLKKLNAEKIWTVRVGDQAVGFYNGNEGSFFVVHAADGDWRAYFETDGFEVRPPRRTEK